MIIEDAAYAFLAEHAPPPLATLAPERTVYVGGFSKSVATGLRVGFVSAPAAWVKALERSIHGHDLECAGGNERDCRGLARRTARWLNWKHRNARMPGRARHWRHRC